MNGREPVSAVEALDEGQTIYVVPLIADAIEQAKWSALGFQVEDIFSNLFPDKDIPEVPYQRCVISQIRDRLVLMLIDIQREHPDIAGMIFEAAEAQDIILDESVISERRSHLKLISDIDHPKMQEDPSGPVPE